MDCKTLKFSRHAFERMFQHVINPDIAAQIIAEGEVIIGYPDDQLSPVFCCWRFMEASLFMR
jgi:hypothetical protein